MEPADIGHGRARFDAHSMTLCGAPATETSSILPISIIAYGARPNVPIIAKDSGASIA